MFPLLGLLAAAGRAGGVLSRLSRPARGLDGHVGGGGVSIRLHHNIPEVIARLELLHKDLLRRAAVSAVNKTAAQGRTAMSRRIREEFNMKARNVNDQLKVSRATIGMLGVAATLAVPRKNKRSLNLINFDAKQAATGVTVRVKRGGKRKLIPGAFIANKGRTVFIRVGKKRLPIKALQTIDVAQMFNARRINSDVVTFMQKKFPDVFKHEIDYFVARFNRR